MKNLLLAITLLGASIASAKTYSIRLSNPAFIGNSQLKSGEYKLELKGDSVLVNDGRMVNEFPVRVENEARKFDTTSVTTRTALVIQAENRGPRTSTSVVVDIQILLCCTSWRKGTAQAAGNVLSDSSNRNNPRCGTDLLRGAW